MWGRPWRPTARISGPDCSIFFTSTLALSARALSCARDLSNAGGAYFFLRVPIRPVEFSTEQAVYTLSVRCIGVFWLVKSRYQAKKGSIASYKRRERSSSRKDGSEVVIGHTRAHCTESSLVWRISIARHRRRHRWRQARLTA